MIPRRPDDNGIGIHLWPNQYGNEVNYWLDRVVEMKLKWVTTLNTDPGFMKAAADRKLQVVCRPFYRASREWGDDGSCVENMRAAGLTPLIQIYNEPELLGTEWEGGIPGDEQWAKETWANRWLGAAVGIFNRGGWPGIQLLDPEWYRYILQRIKNEQPQLIERLWFCCHNYMSNHPPHYPYDALNVGKTIHDDWFALLAPLKFDRVANEVLGCSLPTICGEGGYCVGDAADNRYPTITHELHRDFTIQMLEMFHSGVMPMPAAYPNEGFEALPDWWIAVTPWLLVSQKVGGDLAFEQNAWYSNFGDKTLTIEAVKALPLFVRKMAGDAHEPQKPAEVVSEQPQPQKPAEVVNVEPQGPQLVFKYELAFKEYADRYPDTVGKAISPMVQVTPEEVAQRTEKGVLWWKSGEGVTFYTPYDSSKKP